MKIAHAIMGTALLFGHGGTCGGRVASETFDGEPSGTIGTGTPTGCPLTPPTPGQSCGGGVYYCHYFDSDTDCADSIKCTYKGSVQSFVSGGGSNCKFVGSACAEGEPCGIVFEPEGACIVAGERICQCYMGSTLRCRSL